MATVSNSGASGLHVTPAANGSKRWLDGAVGYEVYVRSFADSTGDGVGDIPGITGRLDYLKWLGIDIVWVTPFMASPGHDHGYDVSNYCEVNPLHGTLDDVDDMVARAHQLGMRVIFDIVPNHTSSEHRWFKKAIEDPTSPERSYYLFRDPAPDGGPPNNWLSHFGPTAWTLDPAGTGQYYCHLFLPEQPDLNWRNPAVQAEFDAIYRFWFERGVDGFRIDVAHGLLKHAGFHDNPQVKEIAEGAGPMERFFSFEHRYDMDQDDNVEIFNRWQAVATPYDAVLLAESGVENHERLARYVQPGALDLTFFLKPGWMAWDPKKFIDELVGLAVVEPHRVSWVISNHDGARPASRLGEGAVGRNRALAVSTLMFSLGGVPFLYQGEELGSPNGVIRPENRHDPISTRNETDEGRDVCRTPMAWNDDKYNGFSTVKPWIVAEDRPADFTVAGQHENIAAPLHRYRRLIALRRHYPDLWQAPLKVVPSGRDDVAVIQRGATLTVANLGETQFAINLGGGGWRVVFASQGGDGDVASGIVNVSAETTVVMVPE